MYRRAVPITERPIADNLEKVCQKSQIIMMPTVSAGVVRRSKPQLQIATCLWHIGLSCSISIRLPKACMWSIEDFGDYFVLVGMADG